MIAYCFASGLIEFAHNLPDGGLPIAEGRAEPLRSFVSGVAEHSRYHRDALLVPRFTCDVYGQPRQHENLNALSDWLDWIGGHAPEGVKVFRSAVSRKNRAPTKKSRGRRGRAKPA